MYTCVYATEFLANRRKFFRRKIRSFSFLFILSFVFIRLFLNPWPFLLEDWCVFPSRNHCRAVHYWPRPTHFAQIALFGISCFVCLPRRCTFSRVWANRMKTGRGFSTHTTFWERSQLTRSLWISCFPSGGSLLRKLFSGM